MRSQEELRGIFEERLSRLHYPPHPGALFAPIRYTLESGGKRLRPLLMLGAYDWLTEGSGDLERVLPAALAVEVFHNFTLLHDDIMDHSDLRRGRETVVKRWGANTAILSGDAMSVMAYQLLEGIENPLVYRWFNRLALGVCKGQQWDMDYEGCLDLPLSQYLGMVRYKTGHLIEGSLGIGAVLAGRRDVALRLCAAGVHLGIAFQLQDDLLDVYGKTEVFGKRCGDDIAVNKTTYLSSLAWRLGDAGTRAELRGLWGESDVPLRIAGVVSVYDRLGVRSYAEGEVERRLARSLSYLRDAEDLVQREAIVLRTIYGSVVGRAF